MTATLLELENVRYEYLDKRHTVPVLRDLSLKVDAGERVALVGRSGSGKTTVLNLAAGKLVASSGTVRLLGQDLSSLDADARARVRLRTVAYVHQDFQLLERYSALENVQLPLRLQGASPAEARERAVEALERVDLRGRLDHTPGQLSGGEQQRVAIARAVVTEPQLLLADEPTGALDAGLRDEILELLYEQRGGAAVLLVTHDPEVASTTDRAITLPGKNAHIADGASAAT